jgi:hypothetical protein
VPLRHAQEVTKVMVTCPHNDYKSEPSRNPIFLKKHFTISRPQKKSKAQLGEEADSPPACAIGAFIGLHGTKYILKTRIWLVLRFYDHRSSNLTMLLKIEIYKK